MNREDLIQKWLDHNLNPHEFEAFKQLEDYKELTRLSNQLTNYKAPDYDTSEAYNALLPKLNTSKNSQSKSVIKQVLKVAAILVVCLGLYFYTTTLDTTISTEIAQKTSILLPDDSAVTLNAESTLSYNTNSWNKERLIDLTGEGYFEVAKGKTFKVLTKDGIIEVLGTEFNVKQREHIFEVICYEGLVAVKRNNKTTKLYPGDTFLIVNGKQIVNKKEETQQPSWITDESSYRSIPFEEVIAELERQYNVTVSYDKAILDTKTLITGRFTHKNLDIALKSITIPLHLGYSKSDNSIILTRVQQ